MDEFHEDMKELYAGKKILYISGGALSGADALLIDWCEERGHPYVIVEADWDDLNVPNVRIKYNKRGDLYNANAGHARNEEMAKIATDLIVFWDMVSRGTKNMLQLAKRYQLETTVVSIDITRK